MARITKALRLRLADDVKTALYLDADRLTDENRQYLNNMAAALGAKTFGRRGFDRVKKAIDGFIGSSGDQRLSTDAKNVLPKVAEVLMAEDAYYKALDYANSNKPNQPVETAKGSQIGKQLPLMVDLDNKKEVNSATVGGVPVNNSKKDKTPTQVETLLNRVTAWRKKNKLGDSKVNQKDYVLDKAFTDIKKDTEIIIQQLRKETGSKKEQAKNLIQLLENTLYGKGKKKKPNQKKVDNNLPDLSANNFKTKAKGNYPHRVAWLQANGSWVSVDLNNRTMTTSLELKNILKAGDMTEKEINKSLSWMQIEDLRARPNSTFRILKESSQPPKDINYMSFGKNDLKVTKNGFAVYENRNHRKHYGADGEERAMKYKRSNYKYPRANNRYSIWNSRKRSSQGQVGFKILRKKK